MESAVVKLMKFGEIGVGQHFYLLNKVKVWVDETDEEWDEETQEWLEVEDGYWDEETERTLMFKFSEEKARGADNRFVDVAPDAPVETL